MAGRFPANLLVSDNVLDDGTEKKTKVSDYEKYVNNTKGFTERSSVKEGENYNQVSSQQWGMKKPKKKKMTMPDLRDVGKKSKEAIGIDKLSYGQVQNAERKEYEMWDIEETTNGYSRFFSLDNWFSKNIKQLPEPVQQTFPFMIVPKASKAEKNNGLDNFEVKQQKGGGGTSNDTWYEDDVNSASGKFGSEKAPSRNIHPTVKPLTLMNYLVVLGSRKGDVVLEPFAGSGTTALACVSQERDYIAIEREEEYYEIAKARLDKLEQPLKMWEKFSG
jgi:DNA modification methylase